MRALASIPGAGAPSQIASFETVPGSANTLASASDPGEIVVSFTPQQSSLAIASTASVTPALQARRDALVRSSTRTSWRFRSRACRR